MGRAWPALSFSYKHWKLGPNVLMHHKGKRSDRNNLFVHHCKTFPNPLNFVMISGPIYLRVFPKKPAALMLLSPGDVMDPIWGDYADGGRDEQCFSRRKMWIPLTNYGKNDEEFGFTLISSFLWRRLGSTPNSSIVNAQLCGCVSSNKSKFLLEASGNKQKERVWDNGRGCMQNAILCQNNQSKALAFLRSIRHCPWMGITTEVEELSYIIANPLPLLININKQQAKNTKDIPRTKVQRMRK